jgi:sucrose-phosphate synthase
MAGNEWINGYLEAILSTGASTIEEQKPPQAALRDGGHFNPTKYFVEEVVASVDESDLYRTWVKVVATRNTRERSSRLENMCWRIWHLARKKKQVLSLSLSLSLYLSLSLSKYIIYLLRVLHWLQDNLNICL